MTLHAAPLLQATAPSAAVRPPSLLQRCACGGSSHAGGECAECRRKRTALQRTPGRGASPLLQREGEGAAAGAEKKPPSNEEQYRKAAEKVGEALLKTDLGKEIKTKASELGEDFVSTLGGKIVTGSAIAGALTYLVAANKELPLQLPELPLDRLAPGLKATIVWEGPVRDPTKGSITFTYRPGAPAAPKKPGPTDAEKYRAETARIAAEQQAFRDSLKPPEEKAAEEQAFWKAYWGGMDRFGLRPLAVPGLGGEKKEEKKEEKPLQRSPAGAGENAAGVAPPIVEEELASGGASLPGSVRGAMERRFGHDFGHVRVHSGGRAGESAATVGARAYTVGSDVVFASGQFSPETSAGRRLLAHELAHVVQQDAGRASGGSGTDGIAVGAVDDPLEREAEHAARAVAEGGAPTLAGPPTATPGAAVLRRDDGGGEGGEEKPKADESAKPAEGGTPAAALAGAAATPTCDPQGFSRKDYLTQPNTSTNDFGLTRLAGTVSMALSTSKVRGGVVLDPLSVSLPPITSVYTKEDTFFEGTATVQTNPSLTICESGKYAMRWTIFPSGAKAIRQGELEHCADLQYAFDVSIGFYAGVVNDLAKKKRKFPSENAAFRHLARETGAKHDDWGTIFECLAKKTEDRDGAKGYAGSHTPHPKILDPTYDKDECKFVRVHLSAASLPNLGKSPTPDVIQGCGESKKARDALAAKAAAAAAAKPSGGAAEGAGTEQPAKPKAETEGKVGAGVGR